MPALPDPPRCIVCNSGPLIALAGIRQLDLLSKLYSSIVTPSAVQQEITGARQFSHQTAIFSVAWLKVQGLTGPLDPLLSSELGPGEAEVIALAHELRAGRVLIDERKGRRIAKLVYGLTVTGTGGILLEAKRTGLVTEIRPLMVAMKKNGYFLSDRLVEAVCQAAAE
jgi:predicted nucleic acid-binding protein